MKIGFDAKRTFQNFTGLGNYSRTLITTLATHCPDFDLHLFAPRLNADPRVTAFLSQHTPPLSTHTPQTKFGQKMKSWWRTYGIINDLKKNDIKIFHGLSNELPIGIARSGIKSVVTVHDLIFERYPNFYPFFDRKMYRWKFKNACQKADIVVAISEQTKSDIVDFYNINPEKIKVIYQSCDPQFYTFTEPSVINPTLIKYNLPSEYILYVGTINERKNLLGIVKALQIMGKNAPPLVAIGDGKKYLEEVENFVLQNNLSEKFYLRKKVDFSDMPAIYRGAAAFVYPSFFEGFGIPIIEALFSGVAVVTSVDSCFAEAGGDGALYCQPSQPESIAEKINVILTNKTLREDLILRGGQHVQQFLPLHLAQIWRSVYEGLA